MKNHPDIKSFMIKNYQAKKDLSISKSAYMPQVYLNFEYDLTKTYVVQSATGAYTTQKQPYQAGITLNQTLYDFGKTSNRVKASKVAQSIAGLSLKNAKELLKQQVKTLCISLILWEKTIAVRKNDLKAKKALYEQAKALQKQGLKTKADQMRFLVEVYRAKKGLAYAKAQFNKAKETLSLYMNEPIGNNPKLDYSVLNKQMKISKTLKNNTDIAILKKTIKKNEALYRSSEAERYGKLTLTASYYKKGIFFTTTQNSWA